MISQTKSVSNDASSFSDRTCTVLNVEGDAFGAGLLQHYVDRTSKSEEGTELTDVRLDSGLHVPALPAPESSPLLQKRSCGDSGKDSKEVPSETNM